jgi:hypothetical protein
VAHATRSHRCHYNPKDRDGWPVACESGVLPFVQVQATDAEHAQRVAHAVTQCPIASVERLEPNDVFGELLDTAASKALPRRFTGEPVTAFGAFA